MSASGRESTLSGRLQESSLIWTWKEIWSYSITESRLDGLLRRPDGCKLEQKLLDAEEGLDENPHCPDGWCFGLSGVWTVWHFIRTAGTMDKWASGRDGTSSGRLAGNRNLWLANSAESSEILLNSGIPVEKHLYIQLILSNQNEANYKLTNSPFDHSGTKITWPVWNTFSVQKSKLLSIFVTKGQRVK
jgi:hypothetical protein